MAAAPRRHCTTIHVVPAGGSVIAAPAAHGPGHPGAARPRRHDHRRAQSRGRRVLYRVAPRAGVRRRAARAAPRAGGAACGPSKTTCLTWRAGSTATTPRSRRRSRGADPQQPLAPPELNARDVDARQVGIPVVRRVGPRIPVRPRSRSSTRSSPRTNSGCCCSSSSSTPAGSYPPTSGNSAISTRRSTRGRCGESTTWIASATATPTASGLSAASTSS